MLGLNELSKIHKTRKRRGRGGDSGGTSGRGHKGQRARSGGRHKLNIGFEGGQMPMHRRLPRRGFTNVCAVEVYPINLDRLEMNFESGAVIDQELLRQKGIIKNKRKMRIKILGNGEVTKAFTVQADFFSASAREAIEKAGGTVRKSGELDSERSAK